MCNGMHSSPSKPFVAWDGRRWEGFAGEKSIAALTRWAQANLVGAEQEEAPDDENVSLSPAAVANMLSRVASQTPIKPSEAVSGATPLWLASAAGHVAEVKHLLQIGTVVNQPTPDGRSPLLAAALKGHAEVVRLLLEGGASLIQDDWTPLFLANNEGHLDSTWRLLEAKGAIPSPWEDVATEPPSCPATASSLRPKIVRATCCVGG